MSNVHNVAVMNVMADDLRFRVQDSGAIEVHVGDQITLYPGDLSGSRDEMRDELYAIGRRLTEEADRMLVNGAPRLTAVDADLASLDAKDPGADPIVIDTDGVEVAA